jgi:hypothetical protein
MSTNGRPANEPSLGQLVSGVTGQVSSLVRLEIELAKTELTDQVRQGAMGGGLALVAVGLVAVAFLLASFAAVYGLTYVMPVWAAFLTVAGIYVLLAALLGFLGSRRFKRLRGPERTIGQVDRTKEMLVERSELRAQAKAAGLTVPELQERREQDKAVAEGNRTAKVAVPAPASAAPPAQPAPPPASPAGPPAQPAPATDGATPTSPEA